MGGAAPADRVLEGICEVEAWRRGKPVANEKGTRIATQRDAWETNLQEEDLDEA